jgi:flagellar protein FliO/FliZ
MSFFTAARLASTQQSNWPASLGAIGQFLYVLLLVVVVSLLAYYSIRLLGMAKFARGAKRNLEIIESMNVGMQSFIHLVRAGEKFMVVGVSRGRVNLITEVDADQLVLPDGKIVVPFKKFMERFTKSKPLEDIPTENQESEENQGGDAP